MWCLIVFITIIIIIMSIIIIKFFWFYLKGLKWDLGFEFEFD